MYYKICAKIVQAGVAQWQHISLVMKISQSKLGLQLTLCAYISLLFPFYSTFMFGLFSNFTNPALTLTLIPTIYFSCLLGHQMGFFAIYHKCHTLKVIEVWTKVPVIKNNTLVSELNKCYHIIIGIIEID